MAAIEGRANAATPGPWVVVPRNPDIDPDYPPFVGFVRNEAGWWDDDSTLLSSENAEFIAHARTDIPALVAEVRRLRAALAVYGDEDNWSVTTSADGWPRSICSVFEPEGLAAHEDGFYLAQQALTPPQEAAHGPSPDQSPRRRRRWAARSTRVLLSVEVCRW